MIVTNNVWLIELWKQLYRNNDFVRLNDPVKRVVIVI